MLPLLVATRTAGLETRLAVTSPPLSARGPILQLTEALDEHEVQGPLLVSGGERHICHDGASAGEGVVMKLWESTGTGPGVGTDCTIAERTPW